MKQDNLQLIHLSITDPHLPDFYLTHSYMLRPNLTEPVLRTLVSDPEVSLIDTCSIKQNTIAPKKFPTCSLIKILDVFFSPQVLRRSKRYKRVTIRHQ